MKILLLNQTFYPDVVATAQQLTDLASRLSERGHQVTVVTSRRAYDTPVNCFPKRETWRGIEIHRVPSTAFGKSAKWKRAVDFASFTFFCCLRLATLRRQHAVVALTSPPLISVIAAFFAKLWRCKFVYWIMDLNPDEAVAAGWLRTDSLATKLLDWASRFSLRSAHEIIALDRFMRDRLLAKGIRADKITVLPPWSHDDAVRYDAVGRERFRVTHGLSGKFVVMYSGNHSPCHPLNSLMEAARQMASESRVAFCFVGGGSEFRKVKQFAEQHRLSNIHCLPYQPLDQLAGSLSAADLHVVVVGDPFVGIVHPCKIYNVLTIGVPFLYIGPKPSHVSEILDGLAGDSGCARVAHEDIAGIIQHIQRVSRVAASRECNHFKDAAARFAKENLLPRLVEALERQVHADAVTVTKAGQAIVRTE